MTQIVARYVICLLFGIILGHIWPDLSSWWFAAYLLATIVAFELFGQWGYGSHWGDYRFSLYILHAFPYGVIVLGILFGSGTIGSFLITIGKIIR